jgi:glycerophosphoryl diester phosphodiesterase
MKIIGHRGAAGIALENTLESIRAAKKAGVDAVEFDVRMTSDKQFVLCHDANTKRISKDNQDIASRTRSFLSKLRLHNGEKLPTLTEALKTAGDTPVFVEVKGSSWARPLAKLLANQDTARINIIAIDHRELALFHLLLPRVNTFAVQQFHATELLDTFKTAHKLGFTGIDMNFWLLNPLTYWLARRNNLEVAVYTVNHRSLAWFLRLLFPQISITTDRPHHMQFLRRKSGQK